MSEARDTEYASNLDLLGQLRSKQMDLPTEACAEESRQERRGGDGWTHRYDGSAGDELGRPRRDANKRRKIGVGSGNRKKRRQAK